MTYQAYKNQIEEKLNTHARLVLANHANIQTLSDEGLLSNFDRLVKTERKITYEILLYINEVELRGLHASLGYGSIYDYLIKHQGYSGGSAQRRVQSARLLLEIPEVAEKIQDGSLNLTQLKKCR
jgi:hypothetical protein